VLAGKARLHDRFLPRDQTKPVTVCTEEAVKFISID